MKIRYHGSPAFSVETVAIKEVSEKQVVVGRTHLNVWRTLSRLRALVFYLGLKQQNGDCGIKFRGAVLKFYVI